MEAFRVAQRSCLVGLCLVMGAANCACTATHLSAKQAGAETQGVEAPAADQRLFNSPDDAVAALLKACQGKDKAALHAIFGPEIAELESGDVVQDERDVEDFARRLARQARLEHKEDRFVILHVGVEDHPFPVPLVKVSDGWFFNTEAGVDEILNRRIGENEIHAAEVCRAYAAAQREYALEDRDGDQVIEYAGRLASTPGSRDGLYWETAPGEPWSPLGPLVAEARAEGYSGEGRRTGGISRPFHGYVYRILTRQGTHAPGGRFDYVINGNMVAGFALIAHPVEWSSSGIMTFIVNSNGTVFQKDLGERTAEIASRIDSYDPDNSWTVEGEHK